MSAIGRLHNINHKGMKNFMIGIDFSKQTFDATILQAAALTGKGKHQQFQNSSEGFKAFEKWVMQNVGKDAKESAIICGENTGLYSRQFSNKFSKSDYTVWLESALQIKRSMGLNRGKNDKKDSRDIAEYAGRHLDKCKPYIAPSEQIDALQELFSHRRLLMQQKCSLQRRSGELSKALRQNKWLKKSAKTDQTIVNVMDAEIKKIEALMKKIIASDPEIQNTYDILTSMKGLALINAVALIVYTNNFKRFDYDARKICSYWGVAPFASQSGTSLNGKPHVSGYADKYLKSLMSQAAISAMRFCPSIKEYAIHLQERGKHVSIVRNNCKNKMLHILVAMVKNGTKYGEQKNSATNKKKYSNSLAF
jgi:transposase